MDESTEDLKKGNMIKERKFLFDENIYIGIPPKGSILLHCEPYAHYSLRYMIIEKKKE